MHGLPQSSQQPQGTDEENECDEMKQAQGYTTGIPVQVCVTPKPKLPRPALSIDMHVSNGGWGISSIEKSCLVSKALLPETLQ